MNILNIISQVEANERRVGNKGWRITNAIRSNEELNVETKLRLTNEINNELKIMAKVKGVSKSELIRTYIEWGLENEE